MVQWRRQEGLPVGLRFEPTDEELIDYFLRNRKNGGPPVADCFIKELDIYKHDPEELPHGDAAFPYRHRMRDNEMYFFTPRHPAGRPGSKRVNRKAGGGLWDGHAKNVPIEKNGIVIGRKTMLNFKILAPTDDGKEKKMSTDWLMHEYCLGDKMDENLDALVLCRIYQKNEKAAAGKEHPASLYYVPASDISPQEEAADEDCERLPKRQRTQEPGPSSPPLHVTFAGYPEPPFPSSLAKCDLTDQTLTSHDAGNVSKEPTDDDDAALAKSSEVDPTDVTLNDDDIAFAKSLEVNLTEDALNEDDIAFAKSLEVDLADETSNDADNHTTASSSQNMSFPSSDASNCVASSASTFPMAVVPDVSAVQVQANVLPEEPHVAENQVQTVGSVAGEVPDDTWTLSTDCFPECDWEPLSSLLAFNDDELLEDVQTRVLKSDEF